MKIKVLIVVLMMALTTKDTQAWIYSTYHTGIDDVVVTVATTKSKNRLSLGFPYRGVNYGRLEIRKPKNKLYEVSVFLDKGIIMENGKDVLVKFDEEGSRLYRSGSPDDLSSKTISIYGREPTPEEMKKDIDNWTTLSGKERAEAATGYEGPKEFMEGLAKSKKVRIELLLFNEGYRILEFDVSSLDTSKME